MAVNTDALKVDTSVNKQNYDGTISSILTAKDRTRSNVSQQAENLQDTTREMENLNKQMEAFRKSLEDVTAEVKRTQAYKDYQKAMKEFNDSFHDASNIVKRGSTDIITLTKNVEKSNNAYDAMSVAYEEMKELYDAETKQLKQLSAEKKKQLEIEKADLRYRKQIRANQSKSIIGDAGESNKSLGKSVQQSAYRINDILSKLDIRRTLDQLADASGRSSSANIQLSMMNSYNLSKSEFNSFKKQLYNQIDTSIYNSKDVKEAIGSLQEIGINNTEEAVEKFNTIIRGQQLLGITAQQQAKLQSISNKTGRDYLTFTTNKMAKIMSESNNINKKQLNELIDLNSNIVSQFTDIGISSPEFENATASATAALTELMGGDTGLANTYTSIMKDLTSSNERSGSKIGLGLEDYYNQLKNGTNLATMISSGQGTLGMLYNSIMAGNLNASTLAEMTNQGTLTTAEQSLLTHMTDYDKQNGQGSFAKYLDSFKGVDNGEALTQMEDNTAEATSFLGKLTNNFTNWVGKSFDWVDFSNFESAMKIITTLLGIIAASEVISNIGSVFKSLGKHLFKGISLKGTSLLGGTGKGGSLFGAGSFLSGTSGMSKFSYGNGAIGGLMNMVGLGGLMWMGADAFKGFTGTSNQMYGKDASFGQRLKAGAASMVSGSKVYQNKNGSVSVGKNAGMGALSGAMKGAMVGSFFGPLGTAIGGGLGAIAGAIGGWFKGKKAKQREEREKKQLKEQQKIAANTSKTNELLDKSYNSVTEAGRKTASVRSYTGVGDGPVSSPSALQTGIGDTSSSLPWRITSGFGMRTIKGKQSMHNGVDFGIKTGTPIGAPVSGTITFTQSDSRNTWNNSYGLTDKQRRAAGTGVKMLGSDGRTYQFWHLSSLGVKKGQSVSAGQLIGLSGNTGFSSGAHLHFGVKSGESWVNPLPYVTQGLFSVSGGTLATSGTTTTISDSDLTNTPKVFTNKISSLNYNSGMGAVVDGLADIKNTLIELSNRQTRDEQIMQMLQQNSKQAPRTA